jgi:hypothetical protein
LREKPNRKNTHRQINEKKQTRAQEKLWATTITVIIEIKKPVYPSNKKDVTQKNR